MERITLSKDFIGFLRSLLKINDAAVIAAKKDQLTCLIGSPDNVCIAYGVFPCTAELDTDLRLINVSSILKLTKAVDQIDADEITFNINSNNLEYKSPSLRFKFHLLDNGIINQPAIKVHKVLEFGFDVSFKVSTDKLSGLNRFSTFASDSNKVYIHGDGEKVYAELTDKARPNVDSLQFEFATCDKEFSPIPMNLDFFRSLNYTANSDVLINLNITVGAIAIDITTPAYKLRYITTAYTS